MIPHYAKGASCVFAEGDAFCRFYRITRKNIQQRNVMFVFAQSDEFLFELFVFLSFKDPTGDSTLRGKNTT